MSDLQVMSMSFLAQQLAEDQQKQELIEELHSKLGFSLTFNPQITLLFMF